MICVMFCSEVYFENATIVQGLILLIIPHQHVRTVSVADMYFILLINSLLVYRLSLGCRDRKRTNP